MEGGGLAVGKGGGRREERMLLVGGQRKRHAGAVGLTVSHLSEPKTGRTHDYLTFNPG